MQNYEKPKPNIWDYVALGVVFAGIVAIYVQVFRMHSFL
jgi:hypothetical protein